MSIHKIGNIKNSECNKTHLDIEHALERGIVHRDYIAHCLCWSHVLKYMKINSIVVDVGCADAPLAQVLYTNRYRPEYYGIDIRTNMLEKANSRKYHKELDFFNMDITRSKIPLNDNFADIVVCFEVIEHIQTKNLDFVLQEIQRIIKNDGTILLSTPNYDFKHQAKNHIHEYTEQELAGFLCKYFTIIKKYGTFASQSDLLPGLSQNDRSLFDQLSKYYDSNFLSIILAPSYPSLSRNILWVLKKHISTGVK